MKNNQPSSIASRRRFLKQALVGGAALALPAPAWGVSRGARLPSASAFPSAPVRVRGRVSAGGQGLGRVGVTDGRTVAETAPDGTFELIASAGQPFVYLSVPAGYRIPQNETGTARFYEALRPGAGGEQQAQFELEPLGPSDEAHTFFALADPQTQTEEEMQRFHETTVADVREVAGELDGAPAFGVSVGDIMFDDLSLYPRYEEAVAKMGVPFFQVVGNHDLDFEGATDEASTETFSRHFGPRYYSFERGAVHYVVLDDVFWNHERYFGYLGAGQLAWLAQDLARVEAGRPVVVFLHIPSLTTQHLRQGEERPSPGISVSNREALYALLEPYAARLISGHTHESEHIFEGGAPEHVVGATCGAWWSGPICHDGTPSGYAVYEAKGEELSWRYKATGRPFDHQLRVYTRGADPQAPGEIVANVWDWDPEWTVAWYEDGIRKGAMQRRTGLDPRSVALHWGEEKPERRPWVEPKPTRHLFYAAASPEAERVHVEATDRFGRTYDATPEAVTEAPGG